MNENKPEDDKPTWGDPDAVCSHCGGVGHTIGAHF